jgi:hypothetical protein
MATNPSRSAKARDVIGAPAEGPDPAAGAKLLERIEDETRLLRRMLIDVKQREIDAVAPEVRPAPSAPRSS